MKKKYIVIPGTIGEHLIGVHQIIRLFGIDPSECLMPDSVDKIEGGDGGWACYYQGYTKEQTNDLIPLRPQEEGDYSLKKATVDFIRDVIISSHDGFPY